MHIQDSLHNLITTPPAPLCSPVPLPFIYIAEQEGCVHVWLLYDDHTYWHHGERVGIPLYTTVEIYHYAQKLFAMQPQRKRAAKIGVTAFDLLPYSPEQLSIFDNLHGDRRALSRSLDKINDRYGDMVVGSALLMGMGDFVLDRVAFGSVKDMQELYDEHTV